MPARLKVFRAQMGFFDAVVAAPSQKAALEAWGTRQDLFHEGMAAVTDDPQAVEAALAAPGQVLQRPVGSTGPFEHPATAKALPQVPKAPPKPASRREAEPKPPPDRSALTAAEQAIAEFEAEQTATLRDISRDRAELEQKLKVLDARELDVRRGFDARHRDLQRGLDRARKAYQRAGGEP